VQGALASKSLGENVQQLATSIASKLDNLKSSGLITSYITNVLDEESDDNSPIQFYIHHPQLQPKLDSSSHHPSIILGGNDTDTTTQTTASMKRFDIDKLAPRW